MKLYLITFRSVTYAQRGARALGRGLVVRTPRKLEEQGCGYGLKLRSDSIEAEAEILQNQGIPFRKLWLLGENGEAEAL